MEKFYVELHIVMDKVSNSDVHRYCNGNMNANGGYDNTKIENAMEQQGAKCKMHENGKLPTNSFQQMTWS